ncbi:hypothetical protein [Maricaulis sp.]|uniref:hypothetical protein n=1 Tax=Maricaulis sp. TaxID=1486257 RepID=UPI00260C9E3F|nr:hypothetical protein [Maricaulis sp.]
MVLTALALSLALQEAQPADEAEALPADETVIDETLLDGAEEDLPPPPPTDAASLIAQIDGQWAAYGDLAAELAARRARERFFAELILPVIARDDLDDGAQGEILRETRDTSTLIEEANTQWAVAQLDPEQFPVLYLEQSRLARQILRWAERDRAAEQRILMALEPVAFAGAIDGSVYAQRVDVYLTGQNLAQLYGTQEFCIEGTLQPGPIDQAETLDARRTALGLTSLDEAWADRLGTDCDSPQSED